MIPLPVIIAEFVMAFGAALAGANIWVLVRPRLNPEAPHPTNPARSVINILLGFAILGWGVAPFFANLD